MESMFGSSASDKSIVMKAFNNQFFEFFDELVTIYPDCVEILTARETFNTFKKMNPTSIIKVWNAYIYIPYKEAIDAGNIEFFTEKDYRSDLSGNIDNIKNVLEMINNVREPIRNLSDANRSHAIKYLQNMSKLSTVYSSLT